MSWLRSPPRYSWTIVESGIKHHKTKTTNPFVFEGFMIYLCYLYLFTFTGVQHDLYIRCCSCRLTVTRQLSHVEQELLTLPEHLSSHPVFGGVRVARFFVFCVMFCRSLFVLFRVAIELSVCLRFTDTDYPFGIFNLFIPYL